MRAGEVMTTKLVTIDQESTVQDAAILMTQRDIGSVVVVNNNSAICGILTEKDFVKKVLNKGLRSENTLVRDVMTSELITIDESTDISEAVHIMEEHNIRRLLVTVKGKIKGIVTSKYLLKTLRYDLAQNLADETYRREYVLREMF